MEKYNVIKIGNVSGKEEKTLVGQYNSYNEAFGNMCECYHKAIDIPLFRRAEKNGTLIELSERNYIAGQIDNSYKQISVFIEKVKS